MTALSAEQSLTRILSNGRFYYDRAFARIRPSDRCADEAAFERQPF